jgi:GDP-L-fucose synthase
MKVLVTGARGFIGSYLTPELRAAGCHVVAVDREEGDLARPQLFDWMLAAHRPDMVVHLAAKYGRLKGEVDPAFTVEQNALVTTRVAKACGEHRVRLVYVSSSEVYGDCDEAVCLEDIGAVWMYPNEWPNESDQPQVGVGWAEPHNMYGLSKLWGEQAAKLYAPEGLLILRLNMPYGPGQEGGWGACALIRILEQARDRTPIPVHRGAERSWCYITDTIRAMRLVIERSEGGVFNVGRDDNPVPIRQVAELACALMGAPYSLIREVDPPPMQTVVKRLSAEKIRALGWEPRVSLRDGMARTLESMTLAAAA